MTARQVDWETTSTKPSWFLGSGATAAEKAFAYAAGAFGVAVLLWTVRDLSWPWWKYLLGMIVVFDIAGGVVANGLNAVKRFYHGPLPLPPTRLNRVMHHEIGFAACHVQPVLVGLVFGGPWWWGPLWYAWALAAVVLVARVPLYLARPAGLFALLAGIMIAPLVAAPPGFAWLPVALLAKLAVAHAVPEEPYGRSARRA
ncbi:hypothetical protein [Actinomadura sp. B10D3]|uniref:hypothetical protein n=1 Tax=Actinomadura sp. B10D3 TaxID=3153557 RepID=UPI00325E55D6